jgi:hypothetical protein
MSIAVEDWDDLSEARRRRDERLAGTPVVEQDAGPAEVLTGDFEPADYDSDAYGAPVQNLKIPAYIAGVNITAWIAGRVFGVVELVGVAFFASVALLLAAYVLREWQRDRIALICLVGALPLPVTIFSLFT